MARRAVAALVFSLVVACARDGVLADAAIDASVADATPVPGDAGPAPTTCEEYARADCALLAVCAPLLIDGYHGGSVPDCEVAQTLRCERLTTLPGSTYTFDHLVECWRATSCDTIRSYQSPPECEERRGTRADGEPCAINAQCASLMCDGARSFLGRFCETGTCAAWTTLAEGEPCGGATEWCAYGFDCAPAYDASAADLGQSGERRCVLVRRGAAGEPCASRTDRQCGVGLFCDGATHVCAPTLPRGARCTYDFSGTGDDPCGLFETWCTDNECRPLSSFGDACTTESLCWIWGRPVDCVGGTCPSRSHHAEGSTCDSSYECAYGLGCFFGVCRRSCCEGGTCPASQTCGGIVVGMGYCATYSDCDALAQTGCPVGEACFPSDWVGGAERICAPPGAAASGDPCVEVDDCAAGLACYDGVCHRLCDELGGNPTCGPTEGTCYRMDWPDLPDVGLCRP